MKRLVESLAVVFDTQMKLSLLHDVCQLLPKTEQTEFDRIAAIVSSRGKDNGTIVAVKLQLRSEDDKKPVVSARGGEEVEDVLYRVQLGKLSPQSSSSLKTTTTMKSRQIGVARMGGMQSTSFFANLSFQHWIS